VPGEVPFQEVESEHRKIEIGRLSGDGLSFCVAIPDRSLLMEWPITVSLLGQRPFWLVTTFTRTPNLPNHDSECLNGYTNPSLTR
jgi:hypothetical protein